MEQYFDYIYELTRKYFLESISYEEMKIDGLNIEYLVSTKNIKQRVVILFPNEDVLKSRNEYSLQLTDNLFGSIFTDLRLTTIYEDGLLYIILEYRNQQIFKLLVNTSTDCMLRYIDEFKPFNLGYKSIEEYQYNIRQILKSKNITEQKFIQDNRLFDSFFEPKMHVSVETLKSIAQYLSVNLEQIL